MNAKTQKTRIQELIYGLHPLIEVIKAKKRKIYTVYTTRPALPAWQEIEGQLAYKPQVNVVERDVLNRLAGTTDHQSIVAYVSPFIIRKKFFEPAKSPFLVMLDEIQDPRNVGAIMRSAYCTGVDGVIMTTKNSSPLNATALKSSAGLAEHLDLYQIPTAQAAINELKKAGYAIYCAALGGKDATKITFEQPLCIIIGNEHTGIPRSITSQAIAVELPQRTTDISYNASVAAGILLFTIGIQNKKI